MAISAGVLPKDDKAVTLWLSTDAGQKSLQELVKQTKIKADSEKVRNIVKVRLVLFSSPLSVLSSCTALSIIFPTFYHTASHLLIVSYTRRCLKLKLRLYSGLFRSSEWL